MKIAFLYFAFYTYVISANEESDEQPVAKHTFIHGHSLANRFLYRVYRPTLQPRLLPVPQPQFRPLPQPRPQSPRMSIIDRFVLSYFLYRALRPASTTATTTTTVPISTTTTTTTTENPLAGWTEVGDCFYIFPESTATWGEADSECKGLVDGGRLAVDGFNADRVGRRVVTSALGWTEGDGTGSFWIGAEVEFTGGVNDVFTGVQGGIYFDRIDNMAAGSIACGRVDGNDDGKIVYEDCDSPKYRYVCQYCEN